MPRLRLPIGGASFRRVVFVVLAIPACYFAYQLGVIVSAAGGRLANTRPQQISGLEVAASDLDIGEVWEDPNFVRLVTITNRNGQTVEVVDLLGGCECTAVEPRSFSLGAGESQQVQVKIDLTHRYPHQFGVERRELAVGLHPVLKRQGVTSEGWTLTGVIRSRVSLEGRGLAFADMCGQGGPPVTRRMRATAHVPLAGLEASCSTNMATVRVRPVAGQPGRYDVAVTPIPDLPLGPFKFEVTVTAVAPQGGRLPCASFVVDGEMRSPARVIPGQVLLGDHPVGTTAEAVIVVRFPGSGWSVDRIETERPSTAVTPAAPLDNRPTYRIAQSILSPREACCQVRVVVRRPTGYVETIPVPIYYFGLADHHGEGR